MDVFNTLWNHADQKKRPPDDNFVPFTMEEWLSMSSSHKNLSGALRCPLPPELEDTEPPKLQGKGFKRKLSTNSEETKTARVTSGSDGPHSSNFNRTSVQQTQEYIPGLLKFPEFDRVSSLTRDEQRDCLKLFQKYNQKPVEGLTPIEKTEYQLFQCLLSRVKVEQKDFLERAKQDWLKFIDRACKLNGDPFNFFLQHWQDRVTRVMAQYPKHYKKLRTVSLSHENKMLIRLNFIKNCLNIGRVPIVRLPNFEKPFRIATKALRLRNWGHLNIPASCLNGSLHNVPVSRDPNAERLARLHEAKVVISAGGFKCLLDNHDEKRHPPSSGMGKFWILPVIVKEYRSFCNGKPVTKTIVFIDKPLPPPKVSNYDKVLWYHKHALMAAVVHRHQTGGIEFDIEGKDFMTRSVEETSSSVNLISVNKSASHLDGEISANPPPVGNILLQTNTSAAQSTAINSVAHSVKESRAESLLVCNNLPKSINSPIPSTVSESGNCDSEDENQLIIDFPEEQLSSVPSESEDQMPKIIATRLGSVKEQTNSDVKNKNEPKTGVEGLTSCKEETTIDVKHKNEPSENMNSEVSFSTGVSGFSANPLPTASTAASTSSKWENVPPPPLVKTVDGHALPLRDTNVTYNMWSLQPEELGTCASQKLPADSFNLLIRSHIDGCEKHESKNFETLSLACKPEYQLEFGPGLISLSELTRQWAKLSIQPESRVARVRVSHKADMVQVERLSKTDLECEAQILYKENLNETLITFYNILSDLQNLPCGEYLLQHSPDMGLNVELLVNSNSEGTTDLLLPSEYGARPKPIECDVPWQPLDPSVILPRHIYFQCMPCTFSCGWAPRAVLKPRKPQKMPAPEKKKPKKNKRKNKKGEQGSQ